MDLTHYFDANVIERVQKFSEDAKLKHIYGELRTATFNLNKANKYTHGHDNGLLKEATEQLKNARKDFLDRLDELEKSEQQRADAQAKDKYDSEILNLQKQMNDMTARSFKESKWTTYTAIAATLFAAVSLYLSWKQVSISVSVVSALFVYRLRSQADVPHNRNPDMSQALDNFQNKREGTFKF
jgi:ABC-type multidrug transport system fused ATPase/permease subunit